MERLDVNGRSAPMRQVSQPSSGNVFEDLGFPADEAVLLHVKCDLRIELERELGRPELSEDEAAKLLGLSCDEVARLCTGAFDTDEFTVDQFVDYLTRLGCEVE